MKSVHKNYILILLMMVSCQVFGQETIIKIIDSKSGMAIQFANICLESVDKKVKEYFTSNLDGSIKHKIQVRSTIAISSLGYISKIDTINPGEHKTIALIPTSYNVDEVVITGQFTATKSDKSIYKVDVISNQQIKNKGANNLSELLSTELNLRTSQDASLGSNISIQGLSGEHVKILIDGVPVIGRQAQILDLSQILLSNVDHVEIVEGPMSVVYGSNALAGAINVITRKPTHGKIIGRINSYYETVGIYNGDVGVTYRTKNQSIDFSGGRNFFGGYSINDNSRSKQWKPKMQYFADLGYNWSYKSTNFSLNSNIFYEDLRNLGSVEQYYDIVPSNGQTSVSIGYRAFDEYHYTQRWNNKFEVRQKLGESYKLESILSYSLYRKIKNTYNNNLVTLNESLTDSAGQDTTKINNVVFRSVLNRTGISWLDIQSGVDLSIETATGKRLMGGKRIDDYALFANIKFFPEKKLNIQSGVRFIYNSKYSAPVIYSINIKYNPVYFVGFRLSYGKGFRAPSLKELYLTFIDINHNISGNSNLKAEYSQNINFSVNSELLKNKNHSITSDLSLFYNKIDNKIDFIYDINNPTWAQYTNILNGNYKSMGAELKFKYQFHPRFNVNTGTNYLMRSQVNDLNKFFRSTDYMIDFNYKNLRYLFRIALYYKYTDSWYTSRAYLDKTNPEKNKTEDGYMTGYHTMDFTISRPFFKNSIEVFIGAKNIFNNTNVVSYGSGNNIHGGNNGNGSPVGWGRTYFLKFSYNFLKY